MVPIGPAIGAGVGLIQGIAGIFGNSSANKQYQKALEMQRGDYSIQNEFNDVNNRAGMRSLSGLPAAQRAMYMQNIMRSGSNALNTGNLTRNSSSLIGSVQQNQDDSYNQLLSQDAQARNQNQQYFDQTTNALGQQKVNQQAYKSALAEKDRDRALGRAEQAKAAAQQNIWGGLSGVAQSAGSMLGGLL